MFHSNNDLSFLFPVGFFLLPVFQRSSHPQLPILSCYSVVLSCYILKSTHQITHYTQMYIITHTNIPVPLFGRAIQYIMSSIAENMNNFCFTQISHSYKHYQRSTKVCWVLQIFFFLTSKLLCYMIQYSCTCFLAISKTIWLSSQRKLTSINLNVNAPV